MRNSITKLLRRGSSAPEKDLQHIDFSFGQYLFFRRNTYGFVENNDDDDDDDDRASISTMSTNATADDLPGPGRIIDKWIYQFLGRKIERFANRFSMSRLSPAKIAQCLENQIPLQFFYPYDSPVSSLTHVPYGYPVHCGGGGVAVAGLKSLVRQTQSTSIYRSAAALAVLLNFAIAHYNYANFLSLAAGSEPLFHVEILAQELNESNPFTQHLSLLTCLVRQWTSLDCVQTRTYPDADKFWQRLIELLDSYRAQFRYGHTHFESAENGLLEILRNGCILYVQCILFASRHWRQPAIELSSNEKIALDVLYYLNIFLIHCVALQYQRLAKAGDAAHFPRMVLFIWLHWIKAFCSMYSNTIYVGSMSFKSGCKFVSVEHVMTQYGYFTSDVYVFKNRNAALPRKNRLGMEYPIIVRQHVQSWIPRTRRLFFSFDELDREARETALLTPSSEQHSVRFSDEDFIRSRERARKYLARHMGVSKDDIKSLMASPAEEEVVNIHDSVGRVYAVKGDSNLEFVQSLVGGYDAAGMKYWRRYKEDCRERHKWGEYLRSNLDWDWDVASCLKCLFKQPKAGRWKQMRRQAGPLATIVSNDTGERKLGVSVDDPHPSPPKTFELPYKNAAGKIEYFRYVLEPAAKVAGDKCRLQVPDEEPVDSMATTTSDSLVASGLVDEKGAGDGSADEAEKECVSEDLEDKQSFEDQGQTEFDMGCTPVDFLSRSTRKTISGHLVDCSPDRTERISQWITEVE